MEYQPRTIALLAELPHPPVEPDARALQQVHNQLFEGGPPPYVSFQPVPGGVVLSNPGGRQGVVSQVALLQDRVQFREERTALTPEDFARRVIQVLEAALPSRGVLGVHGCQVTLRSLVNPRHWDDSRALMREGVFGVKDELEALGREPGLFGLRFSFPAEQDELPMDLRIESYHNDPRSLFLELQAVRGPLAVPDGLEQVAEHIHAAYRFLVDRALPFVARYDLRPAR
ncbi:MAG: hypothetical protein O2816_04475 [Planctomycetota bacterium]|nr:hypothetical protein [Planctomycetota bacterium]